MAPVTEPPPGEAAHIADPAPAVEPWRHWVTGQRVMVRLRLPEGGSHLYTDVIGEIVVKDDTGITLRHRTGEEIRVHGADIAVGKLVPPPPARKKRDEPGMDPLQ